MIASLRRYIAPVLVVTCFVFGALAGRWTLPLVAGGPPHSGLTWYVIGQEGDCADGYRAALRVSHLRHLPATRHVTILALSGAPDPSIRASWTSLGPFRRRVVTWHLWLNGFRQTPVLAIAKGRSVLQLQALQITRTGPPEP